MGDELVDLEPPVQVVLHQARQLRATLDAAEGAAAPDATGHELERCEESVWHVCSPFPVLVSGKLEDKSGKGWFLTSSLNLLPGSRDADDNGLAPPLVARFQGGAHDADVTRAVKGVVAPAVGHLDQLVDDAGALGQLGRVEKVRRAELPAPRLLVRVEVDDDDLAGPLRHRALHHAEPHAARAEHGDAGPLLDLGRDPRRAVAGRDAAPEQARLLHRRVLLHRHDRDVRHDGVLREGRAAHKVQQVLALAPEPRGPVGHQALALGGADLAAEVRLARLAELALFTFWRAVGVNPKSVSPEGVLSVLGSLLGGEERGGGVTAEPRTRRARLTTGRRRDRQVSHW